MGIIYKITNSKNGKIYIGQTIRTLKARWYYHVYLALRGAGGKLARAIRKYGPELFTIEVLEETDLLDALDDRERFYIAKYESIKNGYNINVGGNGGPHHPATKRKISKANRKRVWTEEMRKNMSEAIKKWHKKRGRYNHSDETKAKIAEANRRRKMPVKARNAFAEHNRKTSKRILCESTGVEYQSIAAACKALNLNVGHMSMHLRGKCSHVKGYTFRLLMDEDLPHLRTE